MALLFTRKLGAGMYPEHTEQARTHQVQQGWQIREPGESCMVNAEMEGTLQGEQVDGQPLQEDGEAWQGVSLARIQSDSCGTVGSL